MFNKKTPIFAAVLAAGALASCGGITEGSLTEGAFWQSSPIFIGDDEAELGLAELAKGNFGLAELHFDKALRKNPADVHALVGLGILYQNTGQATKARQMYEAILAIRPEESEQLLVWTGLSARPISEIASVNLSLLESGGVLGEMGAGAGAMPTGIMSEGAAAARVSGASQVSALTARVPTRPEGRAPAAAGAMLPAMSTPDSNVVSRFKTIISLRDQGLITPDEYSVRRQANIGALLPLTSPPPAAGLDRLVPVTEQISGRLRAIGRALEMRAITVSQHGAERAMILDALMPAAPSVVANPGPPPQGLMEAADAVRRLEVLNQEALIGTDEYTRERTAIERSMQPEPMMRPSAAENPQALAVPNQAAAPSGPNPVIHLASYRSQQAADRGWAQLRRAYRQDLGDLTHEITRVDLGPGKGVFYRLNAGPLESDAAAKALCRGLKSRRQYCEPTIMGAG